MMRGVRGTQFLFVVLAVLLQVFSFQITAAEKSSSSGSERAELRKLTSDKNDISSLKKAYEIYNRIIPNNPQDYELRVQGADDVYYIANLTPNKNEKKPYLETGISWAKQAIDLQPGKAGGHFMYGILTGLKAETGGILVGLKSKDIIKNEMEKVVKIDSNYSEGDAHLALGRWYMEVPSLMGGNDKLAEQHLLKAIQISSSNTKARVALAELYMNDYKYDQAREELKKVLSTPVTASNSFEIRRDKADAKSLLNKLDKKLAQPTRGYQQSQVRTSSNTSDED